MLAKTLQDFLFEDQDVKITVNGEITSQSKEEALAETNMLLTVRDQQAGSGSGQSKGSTSVGRVPGRKAGEDTTEASSARSRAGHTGRASTHRKFKGKTPEGRGLPLSQTSSKRSRIPRSPAKIVAGLTGSLLAGPANVQPDNRTPEQLAKKAKSVQATNSKWVEVTKSRGRGKHQATGSSSAKSLNFSVAEQLSKVSENLHDSAVIAQDDDAQASNSPRMETGHWMEVDVRRVPAPSFVEERLKIDGWGEWRCLHLAHMESLPFRRSLAEASARPPGSKWIVMSANRGSNLETYGPYGGRQLFACS